MSVSTRLSGILHSLTQAVILLGAGRYASLISNSVLAGILITVGLGMLDYKGWRHIAKVPRADAAVKPLRVPPAALHLILLMQNQKD